MFPNIEVVEWMGDDECHLISMKRPFDASQPWLRAAIYRRACMQGPCGTDGPKAGFTLKVSHVASFHKSVSVGVDANDTRPIEVERDAAHAASGVEHPVWTGPGHCAQIPPACIHFPADRVDKNLDACCGAGGLRGIVVPRICELDCHWIADCEGNADTQGCVVCWTHPPSDRNVNTSLPSVQQTSRKGHP